MIRRILFLWLLSSLTSCSLIEKEKQKSYFFPVAQVTLECEGSQCPVWKSWLEEIIHQSSKHKITKAFYQKTDTHYFRAAHFLELLQHLGGVVVSYSDYHCLDNQISCTFLKEKTIYFNQLSLTLNKWDWMRIFWHEVFHLVYPEIQHISCAKCSGKSRQQYSECDVNSFSSYGLERFWVAAHAEKFSSDKSFKKKNEVLKELENRICR